MANYPDLCKDTLFPTPFTGTGEPENSVKAILELMLTWYRRSGQRRRLGQLDEHLLRDIGLSHADVETELNKPFWVA